MTPNMTVFALGGVSGSEVSGTLKSSKKSQKLHLFKRSSKQEPRVFEASDLTVAVKPPTLFTEP